MIVSITPDGSLFLDGQAIENWLDVEITGIKPSGKAIVRITLVTERPDIDLFLRSERRVYRSSEERDNKLG